MDRIKEKFAKCKQEKRAALVAYVTAGYPTIEETVDILLALECGGTGGLISLFSLSLTTFFFPFYMLPRDWLLN
jgi:Tryptophan synthase alpha chain